MEGEFNFLMFLPEAVRQPLAEYWYRNARDGVQDYIYGHYAVFNRETGIEYRTGDPQREFYDLLKARLAPVLERRHELAAVPDETLREELEDLASVRGRSLAFLPEMSVMRIDQPSGPPQWFTVLRDTAHSNVTHLLREESALIPDEDALTVAAGFIGDYPNAFFRLQRADLPAFTAAVRGFRSEADYHAFATRFAVRRTYAGFWAHSDAVHLAYRHWAPAEAAMFDYNRLENR
jgi:Fatty acid cis/trans isomerase (CTI)